MAKRPLKIFKTPIGFHDAYVAAPSRKAALAAWGAGTDLFSAGIAEEVKEATKDGKAALARPGEVVRVKRGGGKEEERGPRIKSGVTQKSKRKAKPSRAALEKAEAALAALDAKQAAERAELAKQEQALARRRRAQEERHAEARAKAQARLEAAEDRYRSALRDWGG